MTPREDLKGSTFIGLTNQIKVISIAMHSNHIPDWGTKQELNDKNSDVLYEIAKELERRNQMSDVREQLKVCISESWKAANNFKNSQPVMAAYSHMCLTLQSILRKLP